MLVQRIPVAPSVLIAITVTVVHLAAAGLLWLVPIPVTVQAALTLAVAVSLVYYLARDATLHAAHSIVMLELRAGGEIACRTRRGAWLDCELLGATFVSPRLTVVNLRPRGKWLARRVILVPDNVDARDFRRLRMWLRWKSGDGVEPAQPADP
jgi:toxin CptA